jgi:hypothetical protein
VENAKNEHTTQHTPAHSLFAIRPDCFGRHSPIRPKEKKMNEQQTPLNLPTDLTTVEDYQFWPIKG